MNSSASRSDTSRGSAFQLADSALEIEAAQLLTLQAASRVDDGTVTDLDVAMAKLAATETLGSSH